MKKLEISTMEQIKAGGPGMMYGACAAIAVACLFGVFTAPIGAAVAGACLGATLADEAMK